MLQLVQRFYMRGLNNQTGVIPRVVAPWLSLGFMGVVL